tara:strand:+ start:3114 stop:3950 length:837 start_codon:yes stop_codon:yes gene_type:complete
MDLVSVIIPCFNSGRTLLKAIDSIRNQTWKNIEIIVVNDGSDDSFTINVLSKLKSIKVINQINRGLPAARNNGFRMASGNFILPLDADDWLEFNAIELMLNRLIKSYNLAFVYSDLKLEGKSNKIISKKFNFFEQLFLNHLPYCILMHKKVWLEIGGYDEEFINGYEDWDFNVRLLKNNFRGEKINLPLFHYNVSDSGMLISKTSKYHSQIWFCIKNKNKDLYKIKNLLKLYIRNRSTPSNYPLEIYIIWYGILIILPNYFSSYFFRILRNLIWFLKR